jgi:flagellar FliL protein
VPKNDVDQENKVKKAKPKNKKPKLIILISLILLAGSSAGAYFYFNKPADALTAVKKASTTKATVMESVDMSEMVVNLSGNGGGHYLRVKITLEYPKEKKLSEELKKKKPQLSDVIITTLRSKTLDEVSPVSSVDGIKKSLLNEINKNLESGSVTGIYFTDYLVQ